MRRRCVVLRSVRRAAVSTLAAIDRWCRKLSNSRAAVRDRVGLVSRSRRSSEFIRVAHRRHLDDAHVSDGHADRDDRAQRSTGSSQQILQRPVHPRDDHDRRLSNRPAAGRRPAATSPHVTPSIDKNHRRRDQRRGRARSARSPTLVPGASSRSPARAEAAAAAIRSSTRSPARRPDPTARPTNSPSLIRAIPGTVNVQTGAESEGEPAQHQHRPRQVRAARRESRRRRDRGAHRDRRRGRDARFARRAGLVDVRVQLPARCRNRFADVENDPRPRQRRRQPLPPARRRDVHATRKAPTKIERLDKQRVVRVTGGFEPGNDDARRRDRRRSTQASKQPGILPGRRRAAQPTATRSSSPRRVRAWGSRSSPRSCSSTS